MPAKQTFIMKKYFSLIAVLLIVALLSQAKGLRVLFIGDSITDGNWGSPKSWAERASDKRRHWDMNHIYGSGFMYLCATHYQGNYPEREYEFFNRGISGNTLTDMEKRWEEDAIAIKPDVLSVLIGTNDIDLHLKKNAGKPFDFEGWEKLYRSLLDTTLSTNPNLKIVLCAPFVANTGKMKKTTNFAQREEMVGECAKIVERIAKDYNAIYMPFGSLFRDLHINQPTSKDTYWIWDGIHPTPAGHKRMADMWIERVGAKKILH